MQSLILRCALLSAGLALCGGALAQDERDFICQSLDPSQGSYSIQCRVVNGAIDEQDQDCGCGGGFVLVDPEVQPLVGPNPNVVSDG